jgi:arabinogalactan endo-1,4-beta-galactosidase
MNINDQFPSKYLKASDLQGRNVTVKMARVEHEKIGDDEKPILYFQGKERGVVLNKTNANNIAAIYGYETDDWYGKEITLVEAMVDFQGKSVPAIRMKAPPRSAPPVRREDPISSGPASKPMAAADMDDDIPFAPEWRG